MVDLLQSLHDDLRYSQISLVALWPYMSKLHCGSRMRDTMPFLLKASRSYILQHVTLQPTPTRGHLIPPSRISWTYIGGPRSIFGEELENRATHG
jgi:hypothetical protein